MLELHGADKALFAFGSGSVTTRNLVSSSGVIATDASGAGTGRFYISAAMYGGDKAIFAFGSTGSDFLSMTNLVSNTGVVASDTTGTGTGRIQTAGSGYSYSA